MKEDHGILMLRAQLEVPSPFEPGALDVFLSEIPPDAEVTVTTLSGGSQRDPVPAAYIFNATWRAKS